MLNTFNWVSSKLVYPKVNPADTPNRMTRASMRHPKMILGLFSFRKVVEAG